MLLFLVVLSVLALALGGEASKLRSTVSYCPSLKCADKYDLEIDRWDCIGRQLLGPLPAGKKAKNQYFVEHDCGGVGWGNSIRGLYNSASLAAVTGRRLIVTHKPFNRMFSPPYQKEGTNDKVHEYQHTWDYGLFSDPAYNVWENRQVWDYEAHGRSQDNYKRWTKRIKDEPLDLLDMKKTVMQAGVCGGDRGIMLNSGCFQTSMPLFHTCASKPYKPDVYVPDNLLPAPFFYMLFKRPSPRMVELLSKVRERLELPPAIGEAYPGSKGLQTPGYYIFALHIRHIPVGFEPLSIDLNKESALEYRHSLLTGYWKVAVDNAKKAAKIAKCRGETLVIYFATDDASNLRDVATEKLGKYGKVVFGLDDSEVGHMSPQWTANDEKVLNRVKKTGSLVGEKSYAQVDDHIRQDAILNELDTSIDGLDRRNQLGEKWAYTESVSREKKDTETHADHAMLEWFILGHSNWLQGHSGSSFAETSAGLGLGPLGVMERVDMVHSSNHAAVTLRRDVSEDGDFCTPVGAADKVQAETCPMTRD